MLTTQNNPGSLSPFRFKTFRQIASSTLSKIRKRHFQSAWRFLVTQSINTLRKKQILAGNKFYCPVCEKSSGGFIHMSNQLRFSWNSACPHCSSRSRHRGLVFLYQEYLKKLPDESKILHFAPEPVFYRLFENIHHTYLTTDYFLEDVDYPKEDIQNTSFEDQAFDMVLCNHVIEHVPEDEKAIQEIYRILGLNGKAIITIPGDFAQEKTTYFDHLDFNGHYRDYGMDFIHKLGKVFPKVETLDLATFDAGNYHISPNEIAFIAHKLA